MNAYVLVGLREATEEAVLEDFLDFEEVVEGHILFGEWDIILKLKITDPEQVAAFVIEKVRSNPDVKLTSTLIVAK